MFNARSSLTGPTQHGSGKHACGARATRGRPLGGGSGYADVVRPTGSPVRHLDELLEALAGARKGDTVYVAGDAVIECTERVHIEELVLQLPGGVTLASDRGIDGSPGGLIRSDTFATRPLISVTGPAARLAGIRVQGPNPRRCLEHHTRAFREGRGHPYYYQFPVSVGIETGSKALRVDNCELGGWSHSAVHLIKGKGHVIEHSFIHHNQYQGLGYGISMDQAESLIRGNLFTANRHSIAGTGRTPSGYEACHNVEMGVTLSHCFDMHGGRDRKDGTQIAGTWMHIHHNTFLQRGRRAIVVRGNPQREVRVEHNWFRHRSEEGAIRAEAGLVVQHNAWGLTNTEIR